MKVLLDNEDVWLYAINLVRAHFLAIDITMTPFSSRNTTEVYAVASAKRGVAITKILLLPVEVSYASDRDRVLQMITEC